METRAELSRRLKEHGLRVTLPRLAVLEHLASTKSHPTAEEVSAAVNRAVPTASRASVYNVLHSLAGAGLVEELVFDDAVTRYDANLAPHHHFVCASCGRVVDVDWKAATALGESAEGHRVESASVTFRGVCRDCLGRS